MVTGANARDWAVYLGESDVAEIAAAEESEDDTPSTSPS